MQVNPLEGLGCSLIRSLSRKSAPGAFGVIASLGNPGPGPTFPRAAAATGGQCLRVRATAVLHLFQGLGFKVWGLGFRV